MSGKVFIYSNNREFSENVCEKLLVMLNDKGYTVLDSYSDEADLIICVGGDGTFLRCVHKCEFPEVPILGINTGHLGFFQEAAPDELEHALEIIESGEYKTQIIKPLKAEIITETGTFSRMGLNEILITGCYSRVSQFAISIEGTKIQNFCGDGVLLSTNVGSTAYNYSLYGSLISPDLDVIQLTPVAPMNTNAYRCFHSGIILAPDKTVTIEGINRSRNATANVYYDGITHKFSRVRKVLITQADRRINLVRFEDFNYWSKLSTKLL